MTSADRLRQMAAEMPRGPWDWDGGYPQRVTNGGAILIAETFDDPDRPPVTVQAISILPEAFVLLADMAVMLGKTIYRPVGWTGPDAWWADETRELLARLDELVGAEEK